MGKGARACRMPGTFGTHKKFGAKKDRQKSKSKGLSGDQAKTVGKGVQIAKTGIKIGQHKK